MINLERSLLRRRIAIAIADAAPVMIVVGPRHHRAEGALIEGVPQRFERDASGRESVRIESSGRDARTLPLAMILDVIKPDSVAGG